jgi:hypothetical protein
LLGNGTIDALTKAFEQDLTLDQTGNHTDFVEDSDGDGTADRDEQRTHNAANEILTVEGSASHVAHDKAGAMTRVTKAGDSSDHYNLVRDAWGRIVRVIDSDGDTVREFEFDGTGRQIVKQEFNDVGTLDKTLHVYFNGNWQVLEERTGNITTGVIASTATEQYLWGQRYIDDIIQRLRDTNADGTLNETVFYLQDALFDVTALLDASGNVIERMAYTPHGAVEVLNADFTEKTGGTAYRGIVKCCVLEGLRKAAHPAGNITPQPPGTGNGVRREQEYTRAISRADSSFSGSVVSDRS